MQKKLAIYIHWPFCESLCPYCDFNSHVTEQNDNFILGYLKQIDYFVNKITVEDFEVQTIFFGGGTPSLMKPKEIHLLINYIQKTFNCVKNLEITIECNPSSVENKKLVSFAESGVNRVSLGVQALNDNDLKWLGRKHNTEQAIEAIEIAKSVFDNFSFDLIYGREGQNVENWITELKTAVGLAPKHLSLYTLTIEKGTPFFTQARNGKIVLPTEKEIEEIFLQTNNFMKEKGFERYEVSNFAKAQYFQSRHNLMYWEVQDYIGIGAGAHGRITYQNQQRMQNDQK